MLTKSQRSIISTMGTKKMTLDQIKAAFSERTPGPLMRSVYAMKGKGLLAETAGKYTVTTEGRQAAKAK